MATRRPHHKHDAVVGSGYWREDTLVSMRVWSE